MIWNGVYPAIQRRIEFRDDVLLPRVVAVCEQCLCFVEAVLNRMSASNRVKRFKTGSNGKLTTYQQMQTEPQYIV